MESFILTQRSRMTGWHSLWRIADQDLQKKHYCMAQSSFLWMTQVEMAKPIMGLGFFRKTVAEKYGGGIKLSNSENTGGARVEIFFLSSQETS